MVQTVLLKRLPVKAFPALRYPVFRIAGDAADMLMSQCRQLAQQAVHLLALRGIDQRELSPFHKPVTGNHLDARVRDH